ncbi:MAG: glycosyltransferase family 2 protein [Cyanobacteria bacterium J06639_1]
MASSPLVSIIINNYNYQQFLPEAIDSALNQTYQSIEVIVVDDGSTDNSKEVIDSYGHRITSIFQTNSKQGAALNCGFAACRGDLVMFLDADDYLLPEAVARIVAVWHPGIAKVHFRLQAVDSVRQPLGYFVPSVGMTLACGNVVQKLLHTSSYVSSPMSGNAYCRSALADIMPIPLEYFTTADDYLMISSPFLGDLAGIDDPLGAYRVHDSNQWALHTVSGSRFRRFVRHDLQNYALLQQRARDRCLDIPADLERRSLGRMWSRLASLRLDPQEHPVSSDRVYQLVFYGLRALWLHSNHNWKKRTLYSLLWLWVGFMPLPLAKPGITWLYAPHLRPKTIDRALVKLRQMTS